MLKKKLETLMTFGVVLSLLLVACNGGDKDEAKTDKLKIAFVYQASVNDQSWTWAHNEGRLAIEKALGDKVETAYIENVSEGPDTERVIRDFAEKGYGLIFATSFGYMDSMLAVAPNYPDTWFVHISGYKTADNMSTVFGRMYQPRFLSGLVAGNATQSNKLGYVAAFPIPEVIRGINAYTLGARMVNPEATVHVVWTSTWYDPALEKQAAEALLDQGADVITHHQSTTEPQKAAADRGVWSIGYDADMRLVVGDSVLTSPLWTWGDKYTDIANKVLDGTYSKEEYWGGMEDNITALADFSPLVPQEIRDMVQEYEDKIVAGEWDVFCGPIAAQNGKLAFSDGVCMNDGEMLGMDWFVEGVVGEAPGTPPSVE
jgi:basic membrane protein A